MPCAMMHLQCAMLYDDNAPIEFYIGNEAPDCMDVRELKDRSHFRKYKEDREEKLIEYAESLDLNDPYLLGVVMHLYVDLLWDRGPMAEHKRNYKGDDWFRDYRWQIRLIGTHIYRNVDWSADLWSRMCEADRSLYNKLEAFPGEKVESYIIFNRDRDRSDEQGESPDFPHDMVMEFCKEATDKFKKWIANIN